MEERALDPKEIGLKIKWLRKERSLSMRELAIKSDVAVSFISSLEAGKASPTVVTLQKLLTAMNVGIYEFFLHSTDESPTDKVVFKKSDMAVSKDLDRTWVYAFPKHPKVKLELLYEEYQPHTSVVERETYRGDVCGIVLSGELTLDVAGSGVFKAQSGDAFYVEAGKLHSGANNGDDVLVIVSVQHLEMPSSQFSESARTGGVFCSEDTTTTRGGGSG